MKNGKIVFLIAAAMLSKTAAAAGPERILPAPAEVSVQGGTFRWDPAKVKTVLGGKQFRRATAALPAFAQKEAYRLTVSEKGIAIEANTETGAFYARQSLGQMAEGETEIPCCTIYDYPRFSYRGLMIDISRHFRDRAFLEKQIDAMARVKLNRLHLHLTDDAGWRLQIGRYPRLTSYAAWRDGYEWETWQATGGHYAEEGSPEASGGYLTQTDAREIVEYAAAHHVEVIPEIEMPGHSREVLAAYPELACGVEGALGRSELCPGREETFTLLEGVLSEVMEIFPSEYIHIGGDEASKTVWKSCPQCLRRMETEGLNDVDELQSYLIRRIEQFLNAHGRKLLGWDEILEGGLAPNATVMSWRGLEGGRQAVEMGHDAVMTPGQYCYIDQQQDALCVDTEGNGSYLPLDRVYSYDPLEGMPEGAEQHILGLQANLWQEHVVMPERTEYMLYPRAFAIAEAGWSQLSRKDLARFRENAGRLCDRLAGEGYHVFDLRREYGDRKVTKAVTEHLGRGKAVAYHCQYARKYAAAGDATLTDGQQGGWSYGDGRWQGFLDDVDVTVDLGAVQPLHYIGATFISCPGPGIYLPAKVEVSVSEDGEHFIQAAEIWNEVPRRDRTVLFVPFGSPVQTEARYVHFKASRSEELKGWLFTDEIIVN